MFLIQINNLHGTHFMIAIFGKYIFGELLSFSYTMIKCVS